MKKKCLFLFMLSLALFICLNITGCVTKEKESQQVAEDFEGGSLRFHMIDEDATEDFYRFYHENPDSTFDENGELIDFRILPYGVDIMSINGINEQGRNQQPFHYNVIKRKNDTDGGRFEDARGGVKQEVMPVYFYDPKGELARTFYLSSRETFFDNINASIEYVAIYREDVFEGNHITDVQVEKDESNNKPCVTFSFDPEGEALFYSLTYSNAGRYMAILVGDNIKAIVGIKHEIRGDATIECEDLKEANYIANILKNAAYR